MMHSLVVFDKAKFIKEGLCALVTTVAYTVPTCPLQELQGFTWQRHPGVQLHCTALAFQQMPLHRKLHSNSNFSDSNLCCR